METRWLFLLCIAIDWSTGSVWAEDDAGARYRAAVEKIGPSVVRIDTIGGADPPVADGRGRQQFRSADGPTTGVVVGDGSEIVTSLFNFRRDPTIITVRTADGARFVARLIGRDETTQLALLKVPSEALRPAEVTNYAELRVGQRAMAAGYGHGGVGLAVSVGVVSAIGRMNGLAVQTDAKTSPVNYGGPLFDLAGGLLGICTPIDAEGDALKSVAWYDSGIGFAVGGAVLLARIEKMRARGDLERGLMGVALVDHLEVLGRPDRAPVSGQAGEGGADSKAGTGVWIRGAPRGPAAEAGLVEGDQIVSIAGRAIASLRDVRRALAQFVAGDTIDIAVRRDGELKTMRLTLVPAAAFTGANGRPATRSASAPTTQPAEVE